MSLITEALGLRRSKSSAVAKQETLPPFRTRNLGMQVVVIMVMIAGLTFGAVWKGPAVWGWLENIAGVVGQPLPVSGKNAQLEKVQVILPPDQEAGMAKPDDKTPPAVLASQESEAAKPKKSELSVGNASVLTKEKFKASGDMTFQVVDIPLVPVAKDEDLVQAAAKKKSELAAVVRSFQIQGVRLQGRDSRVLIHGNPVAMGESVGDDGLTLKAVEPSRLIFSDASGNEYPRSY